MPDGKRPRRTSRLAWLTAIVLMAALLPFCRSIVRAIVSPGPVEVTLADEDFNEGRLLDPAAVTVTGFTPCLDGWCLAPGQDAALTYDVAAPATRPFLATNVWLYRPEGVRTRLQVSTDQGLSYRTVAQDVSLSNGRVELTNRASTGRVRIRLEARNDGRDVALVLDKMVLRAADGPREPLPGLARVLLAWFGCGLALVLVAPNRRLAAVVVLLVALGLTARYGELQERIASVLDPDTQTYRIYAQRMQLFTETGFFSARFDQREPGFILVTRLVTRATADSDQAMRMLSLTGSLLMIVATVVVGRAVVGDVGAVFLGGLIAVNGPLVHESVRGLRTEFESVALLTYLYLAFVWRRPPDALKGTVLGVAAGLLTLVRMTYLPATLALNALALWQRAGVRASLARVVLATVLAIACIVPHRYGMYKVHGDPFWDTSAYARWNANFEFAGQPGFPTYAELQSDGYIGPRITYREYMFGLHTPREVIEGTVRGFVKLIAHMDQCAFDGVASGRWCVGFNRLFQALGVVGMMVALVRPAWRWLPVVFFLVELPIAFLYDRADRGLVEVYRHTFPAFPIFAIAAGLAVRWTMGSRWPARGRARRVRAGVGA